MTTIILDKNVPEEKKEIKIADLMAMNRRERRRLWKNTGLKLVGSTAPYVKNAKT